MVYRSVPDDEIPEWARWQVGPGGVVRDDSGVLRHPPKPLMRWLADHVDLNALWIAWQKGALSLVELQAFYRDMGYSLCGFEDLFGTTRKRADGDA